jgi:uncharacterized protein (DUF427 family)
MDKPRRREEVTLATATIHNPEDARHFMRIKPVAGRVRIYRGGRLLAESTDALRVLEAGKDIYDPMIYLPAEDVTVALIAQDKTTYCPIKGHATYFALQNETGSLEDSEIAWSYRETLDLAAELKDRIAFYPDKVTLEEGPLPSTAKQA